MILHKDIALPQIHRWWFCYNVEAVADNYRRAYRDCKQQWVSQSFVLSIFLLVHGDLISRIPASNERAAISLYN